MLATRRIGIFDHHGKDEKNHHGTESDSHAVLNDKVLLYLLVLVIFMSVIFGSISGFIFANSENFFSTQTNEKISKIFPAYNQNKTEASDINKAQITSEESAIIEVAGKSSPAVVSIVISKNISTFQEDQGLLDPFFGLPLGNGGSGGSQTDGQTTQRQIVGNGSGFLITSDGYILTNKHVISDEQAQYLVVLEDGGQYPVQILAKDPMRDVAILKINGGNFPFLELGNSDSIKIGQTVIAIGDSLGEFSNSVSRGIVSGLRRNVNAVSGFGDTERLTNIIQTDAAINLGNSGGPLLDVDGKVVGINVAIAQGAENIAFALPINQVKRLIDEVEKGIKISVPYLGIRYIVIDDIVKNQAKLPVDYGVLVTRGNKFTDLAVIPGSPADLAGIVENDIILEINNEKLTKNNQLGDIVAKYKVGDNINLKIWHKGQEKEISVILEELKN